VGSSPFDAFDILILKKDSTNCGKILLLFWNVKISQVFCSIHKFYDIVSFFCVFRMKFHIFYWKSV